MAGSSFFVSVSALSAARGLALASQILVLPVIARYLTPAEFGLAALAMSVTIFANMLSDGGMGRSLVRVPVERATEWSSVFWALLVLGLLLAGAVVGIAEPMAWLMDEPGLAAPLAALAPLPFLLSVNAPFAAALQQRNAFPELALSEVVATAAGLIVAVWMAVEGFGVWALIAQQLVLSGLRTIWVILRAPFRPGFLFSWTALRPHLIFGRDILVGAALMVGGEHATPIFIGKVLDATQLGFFAMAQRFMRLPLFGLAGPASQVIYVRLSAQQEDPAAFRATVLAATRLLAFAILPPMVALAVVSDTAMVLVLSETWAPVATVFALASVGASLRAVTSVTLPALAALGQTGRRLRLIVEQTVVWILMLAGAVQFGIEIVAAARTLWMILLLPRQWAHLGHACGVTARQYLAAYLPGTVAACAIALALLAANNWAGFEPRTWLWLLSAGMISMTIMGILALFWRHALMGDMRLMRG